MVEELYPRKRPGLYVSRDRTFLWCLVLTVVLFGGLLWVSGIVKDKKENYTELHRAKADFEQRIKAIEVDSQIDSIMIARNSESISHVKTVFWKLDGYLKLDEYRLEEHKNSIHYGRKMLPKE